MHDTSEIAKGLAAHAARNRELVALIDGKGADLRIERTVDLHFWASDNVAANGLADALRECRVMNVLAELSASGHGVWNVEGQIVGTVLQVVEPGFIEKFVRLALAHVGRFDGWGTRL